jgi:hypothetical protein
MLCGVGYVLHAVEALPGAGRYALTFRAADGTQQQAVVHLRDGALDVAEASLPDGWRPGGPAFAAVTETVRSLERARALAPPAAVLSDVDGGWDVSLGNVVLAGGAPACTAHGALADRGGGRFECTECGAAALYRP